MSITSFQKKLEVGSGRKLELRINENRSTMLSVRWEPTITRLSLHEMFLKAPPDVFNALAGYIREEQGVISPLLRAFIENGFRSLDYSSKRDLTKLHSVGNVYNLQHIYEGLNEEYFANSLDLAITWFGRVNHVKKGKSQLTFGLYQDCWKLIKINQILDNPQCPDYFVSFVVYHEMLHNVYPIQVDERGVSRIHTKEFKQQEKKYRYYDLAQKWLKENFSSFFPTHTTTPILNGS